jgi:glycosyltransferase involved in cell wall biosynthesis
MEMTGVGRYALETTRAVQRARPNWRLTLFSNRPELLDRTPTTTVLGSVLPTERAVVRVAWLHTAAARTALWAKPDVWFSPAFVLPFWWRGAAAVTIHDLTFLLLRHRYRGRLNASYASAATRWSARHADRVMCGSQTTKTLLTSHWEIEPAKVNVIPYGVAEVFFSSQTPAESRRVAGQEPYVLFVGTWEARKGLPALFAAVRQVNAERKRVRLVLAGQPGWGTGDLVRDMRLDPIVELREKPADVELAELYRGALALAYPSEMEGFGLPVAEGLACGCPVIASDLPSIREFAGDVPMYVTAGDSQALAAQIEQLLSGDRTLTQRIERGRRAVASLRWSVLGERTAATIEEIAASQ